MRGFVFGVLAFWSSLAARAEDDVVNHRDTLVYKDGDRVQGAVISTTDVIVFKSDRFGELRVSATDAVVIKAERPAKSAAAAVKGAPATPPAIVAAPAPPAPPTKVSAAPKPSAAEAEQFEQERVRIWDRFSPSVLTAKVRNYFGPWHGRLALSTDSVSDIAERNNVALDGQVKRKWEKHDVQMNARYDFARTNNVPTTDVIKGSASWRYDITKKQFAQYRPSVEWNRASRRQGVPNEYVLVQQEIGVGYNIITTPSRKLRTGVSQNLFEIWNTAPIPDHTSRGVQSGFEEIELKMPWQMGLTQRGVWYPVREQRDGWENRVELNKKLTETLSTSVRHEMRRNNPDGSSQDYTRLKLLFGFDF